ncbi:MAG: dynamin family protein [Gammaproteobacteria bacterium]|nr:dynamin family protein [Pseudomonadales bacterium]MCP5348855.1 dynamin family protein [Pseudomonadales bacterium]
MKTILKSFCSQFSNQLDPFLDILDPAIGNLSGKSREEGLEPLSSIVAKLQEVQSRSRTLQEKIANQHTYLLIFGPLKSGKSTLMNAISGTYVSEVSGLPTYPALVYVQDGEKNSFQATTYEGTVREFADSVAMKAAIQQDHASLADAILEAEKSGQEFVPEVHHPKAISRVDVELPAPALSESGTVLVDTPGLYSRMKFGYDQMTKDFRDTAACAIFVVKTDDLFFEKVFEEFEELLGCFSRIFLVSNIDSSKQDLQPDGTLHVSLEGSNPEKVIEAFRSLSVSAPLQQAIDDGRLNIYTIDLLKAASRRLSDRAGKADSGQEDSVSAADEPDVPVAEADSPSAMSESDEELTVASGAALEQEEGVTEPVPEAATDGFDHFMADLTSYLNSSDYVNDFVTDTLKAATDLIQAEIQDTATEIGQGIQESCKELNAAIYSARHRIDALNELEKVDWSENFSHLAQEKDRIFGEVATTFARQGEGLQKAVDDWMQNDESWQDLIHRHVEPLLKQEMGQDREALLERLRTLLDSSNGGARFSTTQTERMSQAGVSVEKRVRELLGSLGEDVEMPAPELKMPVEGVPLNLSFMDKLLFRNGIKVRQQFFGVEGEQAIPAAKKQKRLEGAGIEHIREFFSHFVERTLPVLEKEYADRVLARYIKQYADALKEGVTKLKGEIGSQIKANEGRLNVRQTALEELVGIQAAAAEFSGNLAGIRAEFHSDADVEAGEQEFAGNGEPSAYGEPSASEKSSADNETSQENDSGEIIYDWHADDESEDDSGVANFDDDEDRNQNTAQNY